MLIQEHHVEKMIIYNSQYFLTILKKTLLTQTLSNNDLSFLLYFDDFDFKKCISVDIKYYIILQE